MSVTPRVRTRIGVLVFLLGAIVLVLAGQASAGRSTTPVSVAPRAMGGLDCNGKSPIQVGVKKTPLCMDIRGVGERFEDNGTYIGHDEPSVRFISNAKGSGYDVTWREKLAIDPNAAPTVHGPLQDVTHFFELSVAPWFGMALCDPNSYPLTPCKPRSDSNAPSSTSPGGGSGFLELQFYPPGFEIGRASCRERV